MQSCVPWLRTVQRHRPGETLGGLGLAQALRRAGVDAAVFERDAALAARRQGYRLHVDSRAARGLHQCLPTELYRLFLDTSGEPSRQLTVIDKKLRVLHSERFPPPAGTGPEAVSTSVDRLTLREILATGLPDAVRFGREFTHFSRPADGGVRAHFADGTSVAGDVLVAADGVDSRVRAQYLPHATVPDTGIRCISGKTLISPAVEALLSALHHDGFTAVVGSPRVGLAVGAVRFRTSPADAARLVPGARLSPEQDFVMWSVSGQAAAFPGGDAALRAAAGRSCWPRRGA